MKYLYRIAISLLLLSGVAYAEPDNAAADPNSVVPVDPSHEPARRLAKQLIELDHIVSHFVQTITNSQGVVIERSSGKLYLSKPNIRWDVDAPYQQIIVADENELQLYDPDLEQVTKRPLSSSLDDAPLALLTRPDVTLTDHFDVVTLNRGEDSEAQRYELYPRAEDALFARLQLVLEKGLLVELLIYDHVGQQTRIHFSQFASDQLIQSNVFELDYPPGTDIVRG